MEIWKVTIGSNADVFHVAAASVQEAAEKAETRYKQNFFDYFVSDDGQSAEDVWPHCDEKKATLVEYLFDVDVD